MPLRIRIHRLPTVLRLDAEGRLLYSLFIRLCAILRRMGARWCTGTATDAEGRRHSMDLKAAESSYDAAHLYVTAAKSQEGAMLPSRAPMPTLATVFEVVVDGKVYRVTGKALQRWIIRERQQRKGPLYSHAAHPVSDGEHCLAIERISNGLMTRFAYFLINGRLRFSTSQKAFNLYLKYIWRLNIDTSPPPPHCPVDGIVLAQAGISGSWTKCDSVQEYMSWIDRLRMEAKAKSQSLAEWEYQVWPESALKKLSAA